MSRITPSPGDPQAARGIPRQGVRVFPMLPPLQGDAALQALLADTLAAVVTLQDAASGVLMLADPERGDLYTAASIHLTDEYLDLVGRVQPGVGACGTAVSTAQAVVIEDTEADPVFAPYIEAARLAGYRAAYSTLLKGCDGRILGTLATYFPAPHRPSEQDRAQVELYARLAGAAIDNALAHRNTALQSEWRTEIEAERERLLEREREAKRRSDFLAEASRLLASSLEYEPTLATVAGLALPFLGSWCFVDLVEPDGSMRRVAVIHPDPELQKLARKLENGWPPERDDPLGAPRAVRTRTSEILSHVSDEMLVQAAHGEENLQILRRLGIGSLIVAPMIARDHVLGAVTFVSADTGHQYTDEDLFLANEITSRSAIAIENARLLRTAEEANRAKSVFLSTMSHELRTPLNAISGYAELLAMEVKDPLTSEQRTQIERIQTNQRHLLALVNEVLDFARLDVGRMEYDIQPVPVSAAIRDVECVVAPLAEAKGITFPRECGHADLVVRADREKLTQILVNLFTNAVKFTDSGGRVTLRCEQGDGRIRFRIQDTGRGIPPEHLEQIFEPFMQVSEGHTRTEEGTGLGLAISRNLARGMGGEIMVASRLGEGSTFTLDLPQADDALAEAEAVAVPPPGIEDRHGGEEQRSGKERRSGEDRRGSEPGSMPPV
jgi:signal transduction histidine kinase